MFHPYQAVNRLQKFVKFNSLLNLITSIVDHFSLLLKAKTILCIVNITVLDSDDESGQILRTTGNKQYFGVFFTIFLKHADQTDADSVMRV